MKTQSDCISADTYFRLRHAQRLSWLRARAPFVPSVDETRRTTVIDPVYPPLAIQPLTLDRLGWNALRGNSPTLNPDTKTRARFTRVCHFASCLPRGFSRCITRCNRHQLCSGENSLPTRGIKGQDNRGHPPTVTCFLRELYRLPCGNIETGRSLLPRRYRLSRFSWKGKIETGRSLLPRRSCLSRFTGGRAMSTKQKTAAALPLSKLKSMGAVSAATGAAAPMFTLFFY